MSNGIEILQNALNDSNKQNSEAKSSTENKEEIKEDVGIKRDTPNEEVATGVQNTTTNNEEVRGGVESPGKDVGHEAFKKGLSIFSDLKKATEEDKDIKEAKGIAENLADKVSCGLELDEAGEKLAYKMKAEIYIDVIDWLATLGLCAITKDFSEVNKTKFALHKDRRKVIADRWAQYMVISKAKVNPRNDLIVFIAGSYIPMIGVALMIRFGKKEVAPVQQNISGNQYYQQQQNQQHQQQQHQQQQQTYHPTQQHPVVFDSQESTYKGPFGEDMVKKRGVQKGVKRGPYKKDE